VEFELTKTEPALSGQVQLTKSWGGLVTSRHSMERGVL